MDGNNGFTTPNKNQKELFLLEDLKLKIKYFDSDWFRPSKWESEEEFDLMMSMYVEALERAIKELKNEKE